GGTKGGQENRRGGRHSGREDRRDDCAHRGEAEAIVRQEMTRLNRLPQWQALQAERHALADFHLRSAFAADPPRYARLARSFAAGDGRVVLDLSKHRIETRTLELLLELAQACEVRERIDAMFAGERINSTEHRAVLHVALRDLSNRPVRVDGVDVKPAVAAV